MTSFGAQLSAARKAKGYTQEQLAEKLTVSRTNISRWESGKLMPDIDMIKRLSKELDFNFFTVDIAGENTAPADADGTADDNVSSPTSEPAPESAAEPSLEPAPKPSPASTSDETVQAADPSNAVSPADKPADARLHPALKNKKLWLVIACAVCVLILGIVFVPKLIPRPEAVITITPDETVLHL